MQVRTPARLLTVYKVALESVKKIEKADLTVGVSGKIGAGNEDVGPPVVTKIKDPNIAYPLADKGSGQENRNAA